MAVSKASKVANISLNSASNVSNTSNADSAVLFNNGVSNIGNSSGLRDSGFGNLSPAPPSDSASTAATNYSPPSQNTGSDFLNLVNNKTIGTSTSIVNAGAASFILGILSNWYWLVVIPAMTVTYNIFKSLQEHGIIDTLYNNVKEALINIVEASSVCPDKIYDIELFFRCLGW
jgi:hypothetical protein